MRNQRSLEEKIASKRRVIECLECANYSKQSIALKKCELEELLKKLPKYKR